MSKLIDRRSALKLGIAGAGVPLVAACSNGSVASSVPSKIYTASDLDLSTPEARNRTMVKIVGSTAEAEKHGFMRFHIYGYLGEGNLVPFFSMNNYILQKWSPEDENNFALSHYEVGHYTKFDTDEPITHWTNPVTGEEVELETFILGPISRLYTPEGIVAPGIAPNPLRINVIGDRVFVPGQSIEAFPNLFVPDEWPKISTGPEIYWDSMYTFSASLQDVANPEVTSANAEIHMQNFVSFQPFLMFGQRPGRTMVRAFGCNISGFDDLEPNVRAAFEKFSPEIFDTENWTVPRFDSFEYYNKMIAQRDKA